MTTASYVKTYTTSYVVTSVSAGSYLINVPPFAYYGLSGESFAVVLIVVLVLCGAIGFYAKGIFSVRRKEAGIGRPPPLAVTARAGAPPAGVKYCIQCGEMIPEVAVYCPRCVSKQEQ